MEKIEKLEGSYDVPQLRQKLNEIIDHLNSQVQPEEYAERIKGEVRGLNELAIKKLKEVGSAKLVKDTPDQKEEWEKKWEEFFLYVTNNKNWVDGRPEWKGNVYITLYNAMKDFIRQLLEEREMFNKEELEYLNACVGIVWNKWKINDKKPNDIMLERLKFKLKKLSKLNNK